MTIKQNTLHKVTEHVNKAIPCCLHVLHGFFGFAIVILINILPIFQVHLVIQHLEVIWYLSDMTEYCKKKKNYKRT